MRLSIASIVTGPPRQTRSAAQQARLFIDSVGVAEQSPFLFLAEDRFAPPAGFPTHPHRGMETVTFVLDGEVIHQDHTGAHGVLGKNDVQFMTAGGGILHSEMPGANGVHLLQLWLNLPAALKTVPARYQDMPGSKAPVVTGPLWSARIYAGALGGTVVPHGSTWPLTLLDIALEPGARLDVPIPGGQRAFALVLSGTMTIGDDERAVRQDQVAWVARTNEPPEATDLLPLHGVTATRVLVLASPIIEEPVALGGPFVMNTRDEIEQAFADYRAGRLTEPRADPVAA